MTKRPSAAVILSAAALGGGMSAIADGVISRGEALMGTTVGSAAITAWGLKAASSMWPTFGSKYRGFLGSVGLKP
jgi:hypothetical protein